MNIRARLDRLARLVKERGQSLQKHDSENPYDVDPHSPEFRALPFLERVRRLRDAVQWYDDLPSEPGPRMSIDEIAAAVGVSAEAWQVMPAAERVRRLRAAIRAPAKFA